MKKKLDILILTPFSPYPPNDGGKICIFGFIDYLRKYHNFTCLIPAYTNTEYEQLAILKQEWPEVKIYIADLIDKTQFITNQEEKKRNLIRRFASRIKKIIKKQIFRQDEVQKVSTKREAVDMLKRHDFCSPFGPIEKEYIAVLTTLLKESKFDIIQVELTRYLNLVKTLPSSSKIIFEQLESRHEILRDYLAIRGDDPNFSKYVVETCEDIENFLIGKYDAVLALNEEDGEYLKRKIPNLKVFISPFGVLEKDINRLLVNSVPVKIVFSGNGYHYPNYDALNWYLAEMHTLVYEKTKLKLYVTGNWPEDIRTLLKETYPETTEYAGYVENYSCFLENSIMIVPVRLGGGGLRAKVLYAMANGVPVVSTSAGMHGIQHTKNSDVLIADSKEDFIGSIMKYHNDESFYKKISENSIKLVDANYTQAKIAEIRNGFYKTLIEEPYN